MSRIRLALLGHYPINSVATGGAENVCFHLAALLSARDDIELHVVTPAYGLADLQTVEQERLCIHAVGCKGLLPIGIHHYLKFRRGLKRVIRRIAPDVAHAEMPTCGLWSAEAGIPTITTVHGMYNREAALVRGVRRWFTPIHLHYFRKALRKARFIISVNPYAQDELEPHTEAEFTYIPNPVDPCFFKLDPGRAEDGRILFVGSLIRRKCIAELLEAFRSVYRDHPEARLRLAGKRLDEEYFLELTRHVEQNGLKGAVTFAGTVPQDQLLEEYERTAMLVLMSRQETAPGTIGEAMAAGKAVVATRICGIPYMVDEGVTGLLADAGDIEGFADGIGRLLDDPDLCRRMGQRGREKAIREFHPDRVVEETVKVYHRVLDEW